MSCEPLLSRIMKEGQVQKVDKVDDDDDDKSCNRKTPTQDGDRKGRWAAGYGFNPLDHELILDYLKRKVNNEPLPNDIVKEVQLYNHNPQHLAGTYAPILYLLIFLFLIHTHD